MLGSIPGLGSDAGQIARWGTGLSSAQCPLSPEAPPQAKVAMVTAGRSQWIIGANEGAALTKRRALSMVSNPDAAANASPIGRAEQVLRAIACLRDGDFSGVGVVFYEHLAHLPHLQLTDSSVKADPGRFIEVDLATALSSISVMSSPLHDGFHFVDTRGWRLTHLSQFIAPPIPPDAAQRFHGTGARLMAALLASLLPGIVCVGLVTQGGEIHLFRNGSVTTGKD